MRKLNIFYQEPDPDRWFKYDRYPRKIIRKIIRGKQRPGGVQMIAINLINGLKKLNVPYRFNDFKYADNHPDELICLIGKPQLLFNRTWKNPILFGSGIYSHPIDHPYLFEQYNNIKKILVPGEWMRKMFEPYYSDKIISWPVGIDTEFWCPCKDNKVKTFDFLIYDKILWNYDSQSKALLTPIINRLKKENLTFQIIKYGSYSKSELLEKSRASKYCIVLSEHETQGLAYQQILATNTPIFTWDKEDIWPDPSYYPHKVQFRPVTSVPYWDNSCGMKFKDIIDFEAKIKQFIKSGERGSFSPRNYILKNLTLEICAQKYVDIVESLSL